MSSVVVPARAGVFPRRSGSTRHHRGRPRPRGGVPAGPHRAATRLRSSPPARGCSRATSMTSADTAVVPARAGVFRCGGGFGSGSRGRPRPRGGVPTSWSAPVTESSSSPPARGCSAPPPPCSRRRGVVPARAGVFLPSTPITPMRGCRPRPRGGVPLYAGGLGSNSRSSPPARGCSGSSPGGGCGGWVVPTRAGVFRGPRYPAGRGRRRPRPRGGVPFSSFGLGINERSSPPARGCSVRQRWASGPRGVVPARAGVFRYGPACSGC